jgi:hypothetical protein
LNNSSNGVLGIYFGIPIKNLVLKFPLILLSYEPSELKTISFLPITFFIVSSSVIGGKPSLDNINESPSM